MTGLGLGFVTRQDAVLLEIVRAYDQARQRHPPMVSRRDGHSVIEEEYDEFWAAIKADDFAQARREVLQLAAMCLAYLLEVA